ncbi:hypothetical protein GGE67_002951 [Rhizobium leucaenae]|uniref:Uncharacterized protein n=1 Tax=Rhizobium leucaenae TaxID=29450 RepID=A0A7W7EHU2_9HYPH|nr:hypothetical protein [Rhizobium leucaenae]MBB6302332.1 hypothetical protein [Rhizobium leucaenae]
MQIVHHREEIVRFTEGRSGHLETDARGDLATTGAIVERGDEGTVRMPRSW